MDSLILSEQTHRVISRKDAEALGLKRFFTGKPCARNHISERYVVTNGCVKCRAIRKQRRKSDGKRCSVSDCNTYADTKGFCPKHYSMWKTYGDPLRKPERDRGAGARWIEQQVNHTEDECLMWPFKSHRRGYGLLGYRGETISAHVLMCILAHGEKPEGKPVVAHSCGNGNLGCVNPRHLRWSTYLENSQDRILHGRQDYGSRRYNSKLTEADIPKIREMKKTMTYKAIADFYGVSKSTIAQIFTGKTWWYVG